MVKGQVEGFRCVQRRRGRPSDTKATGDSKHQLGIIHAHKWHLSRSTGLFWLKRRWYINYDVIVSNCLFMVDGIPMLISWVLTTSTEHSTNSSKQYLYKKTTATTTMIKITWRLFFVCSSWEKDWIGTRSSPHTLQVQNGGPVNLI